jgi:hypothetical protein
MSRSIYEYLKTRTDQELENIVLSYENVKRGELEDYYHRTALEILRQRNNYHAWSRELWEVIEREEKRNTIPVTFISPLKTETE